MCNPYAYAALQFGQQYFQYQADKAYAADVNAKTQAAAVRTRDEAIYKDISLQKKKGVEYDKSAAEKFKLSLEAKEKKGKVKVNLFERGVQGNMFATLIGDIDRSEGRGFNLIDENYENTIRSIEDHRLAWNRQFTNQILNMPQKGYPSIGSYLLTAGVNSSAGFMTASAPTTPNPTIDMSSYNFNPDGST